MNGPIRLTAVMTHPVQYYAPWFRYITAHCSDLDLTVLYATRPTPAQQGVGFGLEFEWDVPLTEGYRCRVVRSARSGDSVHSSKFWGLNVPEIMDAICGTQPHVVLVPGWHSVTFLRALWTCHRIGVPVLYRGDTDLRSAPSGWRRPVWEIKTRLLLKLFDGYLSVGSETRTYLRYFGVRESQIAHSPHSVDNELFAKSAAPYQTSEGRVAARASLGIDVEKFVVLFVGKLEPKKRPLDLIQALARIGPSMSLLVVGSGELEAMCRTEAKRLGVDVVWAGFMNQSELGRAYAAADCLALVSDGSETWGLVVNEALATGLPCVVSDRVGCGPDMITPGETGAVFEMGDIAALGAALERIRDRARRGHDWAAGCRKRAKEHSFERATSGLLEACRAVTGGHDHSPSKEMKPEVTRVVACCGGMVAVSGLERMTFEVLRVLREHGAAVHCIASTWENHRIVGLADRIDASWSTGHYWYLLDRHVLNPRYWPQVAYDIVRTSIGLLRDGWRLRVTHILIPEFKTALRNWLALGLLRLVGVKVILRLGNAPNPGCFYRRVWLWGINPVVTRFVCNSHFTMQELLSHGIRSSKVRMIYNCAPTRTEAGTNEVTRDLRRVIYVGQVIPQKGLDILLDAVGLLVSSECDVRLDVVGDVNGWEPPAWVGYHARILARAERPDLAGRVRFLGLREDVPALLAASAVHCCPSRPELREGFGIVNVEAKEAGIPSVVFPTGALPELIEHGVNGWVCSEVSAGALANGIAHFLQDPVRLQKASAEARKSAEQFGRSQFANAWWRIFHAGD